MRSAALMSRLKFQRIDLSSLMYITYNLDVKELLKVEQNNYLVKYLLNGKNIQKLKLKN